MKRMLQNLGQNAVRTGAMLALVGAPAALLMSHVWYQFRITKLGYKISEATERHERLKDKHHKLEIQATVESRRADLAEVGRRRFGLRPIAPNQVIEVESQGASSEESPEEAGTTGRQHAALESGERE